jgi:hypothetical protein
LPGDQSNKHVFVLPVSNFQVILHRLKTYEILALAMVVLVGALRIWGDYDYSTRPQESVYYQPVGRTLEIAFDLPVVGVTNLIAPWYPDWHQAKLRTKEILSLTLEMTATWLFWLAFGRSLRQMRRTKARPSPIRIWVSSIMAVVLLGTGAYCLSVFVEWLADFLRSDTSAPLGIKIRAMKILILNGINGSAPLIWGIWLIATGAFCGWVAFRQRQAAKQTTDCPRPLFPLRKT